MVQLARPQVYGLEDQAAIDQDRETRRQRALQGLTQGLQNFEQNKRLEEQTRRQRALEKERILSGVAKSGGTIDEKLVQDVGNFVESGDVGNLTGILQSQSEAAKAGRDYQNQLKGLQLKKLQSEVSESGLPFEQTKEYKKLVAKAGLSEKTKPISESRRKAATFAQRLGQAEDVFKGLEKEGYSRADITSGLQSALPSFAQSGQQQQQEQGERNFINAVLRRESGAAIAPSEFESAEKQYFPRAGDSPETIAQKSRNREIALQGLKAEAGERAMADISGQGSQVQQQPMSSRQETPSLFSEAVADESVQRARQHPQSNQAYEWAKQNPNDPRAAQILKTLGTQ